MDLPSFSIVVPTYQRREQVCSTVRKLFGLDYPGHVEIIVVVDGSNDGTARALAGLNSPFSLRVLEQGNRGLASARNRGAAEARNDVLLFLDDDMSCAPDMLLQHAISYAAGADAVVGQFEEPGSAVRSDAPRGPVDSPFGLFAGQMSVKKRAFEAVGGFDESFTANGGYGYEDTDFFHRLLRGFAVHRNPLALSFHATAIRPLEAVRRGRRCAAAERLLLTKHPELREQLDEWSGATRISKRLERLASIPVVPALLASLAAGAAEIAYRTPLRGSRIASALADRAYTLAYWSAVRKAGARPM